MAKDVDARRCEGGNQAENQNNDENLFIRAPQIFFSGIQDIQVNAEQSENGTGGPEVGIV